MEGLQIDQKAATQGTDFSGGENDPIPFLQLGANLLALTVVHKALATDIYQQVVPHRAMGQEQPRQRGGAHGDDSVVLLSASGNAGIDGFPNAEQTVSQCFSPALDGLLYVHAAATDRAGRGRFTHDQGNRLEIVHLFAIALVKRSDDASQDFPRLERERGVFFRW